MNYKEKIELAKDIRAFEEQIFRLYKQKKIKGTIHQAIGQELHAVDYISQLTEGDIVVSNHRNHAHYLALTQDFQGLKDELMGLETGVNQGKMLSQHIFVKDKFYANGIQGGMCPIACGMAYGLKLKGKDNIVMNFIGDGTLGQGVLYESINLAVLFQLPIVFVVENNRHSMSTRIEDSLAGSINARFHAFGIRHANPWCIRDIVPAFTIIDCYRHCGHSPSDPDYRDKKEKELWKERDILSMA